MIGTFWSGHEEADDLVLPELPPRGQRQHGDVPARRGGEAMKLDAPAAMISLGAPASPGYFALSLAMACPACLVVFAAQRRCPACQSEDIYPVESFLSRRAGRAYERATVAELDRLHALKSA